MTLDDILENMLDSYGKYPTISKINAVPQPDKEIILDILARLQDIVFPGFFGRKDLSEDAARYYLGDQLQIIYHDLKQQIYLSLAYGEQYKDCSEDEKQKISEEKTLAFLSKLPMIRDYLATDADATFDGDPAAFSISEIVFSYPGYYAIVVNRLAHELFLLEVPLIPRIMTEYAHTLTGIDIHPGAKMGKYLMIDHGTGIVVGETTEIGEHVKIYQGVTLGALSTQGGQKLKNIKRHPTIEDNVTIYSNASILGGETVIGEGSTIGGNTFVTKSVPAGTIVNNKAEMKYKLTQKSEDFGQGKF